jgi:hypothetical protein
MSSLASSGGELSRSNRGPSQWFLDPRRYRRHVSASHDDLARYELPDDDQLVADADNESDLPVSERTARLVRHHALRVNELYRCSLPPPDSKRHLRPAPRRDHANTAAWAPRVVAAQR